MGWPILWIQFSLSQINPVIIQCVHEQSSHGDRDESNALAHQNILPFKKIYIYSSIYQGRLTMATAECPICQ